MHFHNISLRPVSRGEEPKSIIILDGFPRLAILFGILQYTKTSEVLADKTIHDLFSTYIVSRQVPSPKYER